MTTVRTGTYTISTRTITVANEFNDTNAFPLLRSLKHFTPNRESNEVSDGIAFLVMHVSIKHRPASRLTVQTFFPETSKSSTDYQ